MSATTNLARREIDRARNAQGMRAGMPKVTIDAAVLERLCIEAEASAELESREVTDEQCDAIHVACLDWFFNGTTRNNGKVRRNEAIRAALLEVR